MPQSGRVEFGRMDDVIFGLAAADAVAVATQRRGAERVLLMVSSTLNRNTEEIETVRSALGNRCAGTFDRMPPHTPRRAVIEAAVQARAALADAIVTIGGGSITDGAKAVQLCLANDITSVDGPDALRPFTRSDGTLGPPPCHAPTIRQISVPLTLSAGAFSAIALVTDERTRVKELFRHPDIVPAAVILDPAITRHTPQSRFLSTNIRAVEHCVAGICSSEAHPFADAQAFARAVLAVQCPARSEARTGGPARRAGLPVRILAVDGTARRWRADGREPWYRLRARRDVRCSAWTYVLHHASSSDALDQTGECRAAGTGVRGDGPSGRRCRRCA